MVIAGSAFLSVLVDHLNARTANVFGNFIHVAAMYLILIWIGGQWKGACCLQEVKIYGNK